MHHFIVSDGIYPETSGLGLIQGGDGKLYGVITSGGSSNGGTVYLYALGLPKHKPVIARFSRRTGRGTPQC
jgi:hypothetical protein